MTTYSEEDRRRITREAIEIGSTQAAIRYDVGETTLKDWRRSFANEPWMINLRRAALKLSRILGPAAGVALRVNVGAIRQWAKEEGLTGEWAGNGQRWNALPQCVECGADMERAGFCSAQCREDYIASGGEA